MKIQGAGPPARPWSERRVECALFLFMLLYYGFILRNAGLYREQVPLYMTFNDMLVHLAHGQFYVDPKLAGFEGFLRNGHVYSYWGITCALLRLPLLFLHRLDLDVTAWSCLAAVCLMGMVKVRTVLFLRRFCRPAPPSGWAFRLMIVYIVFGGAEVGFLKSSIYQEIIFWAVAFAAIFVYYAVKGLVSGCFTAAGLAWMAASAGLATLTRVSTGIGLSAALVLLLLVLLAQDLRAGRPLNSRRFLVPAAVLAAFFAIAGAVNYARWGSPWTFADYSCYIPYHDFPARLERMRQYGLFNPARIPFGLGYYFLPLWPFHGANGQLLFAATQDRLMEAVELPPGTFFLTDLLPIAFCAFLAMAFWSARPVRSGRLQEHARTAPDTDSPRNRWPANPAQLLALAAGLALPGLLMLQAIYMSYRYRMEFYPELDLLAFLGLYAAVSNPTLLARLIRIRRWIVAAAVVSIVSASASMVLYKLSRFGPSGQYLRHGIVSYYAHDAWQSARQRVH